MKTIEERAQELANKSRYWTPGGAFEVRIDFFSEALTELAADLNAEKEKEVAELRETNFALAKLYDAAPHAESCKFIPPILRSELQDASGLYECDCWKSGSLDTSLLAQGIEWVTIRGEEGKK